MKLAYPDRSCYMFQSLVRIAAPSINKPIGFLQQAHSTAITCSEASDDIFYPATKAMQRF